jgi:glycosyltransferase 2 family protein
MTWKVTPQQKQRARALVPWITGGVFLLAVVSVWRMLARQDPAELRRALSSTDGGDLLGAALCVAGSYLTLTLFDWMAVRTVARSRLGYPKIALASFIALSLGHTVGFSGLSSGMLRYRIYSHYGLTAADVARIVLFSGLTVAAGHAALAGLAGLLRPAAVADFAGVPAWVASLLGAVALGLVLLYVSLSALVPAAAREHGWRRCLPTPRVACLQIVVGALNYLFVAATLHRLLGDAADVSLFSFASYYVVGNAIAILSHVPGGLGVLELVVLAAVPGAEAVGALIVFRLVYFIGPFVLGALAYATFEAAHRGDRAGGVERSNQDHSPTAS